MVITPGRTRCIKCGKEKVTSKCSGYSQNFCYTHLGEHRLELQRTKNNSQKYALVQQINQ